MKSLKAKLSKAGLVVAQEQPNSLDGLVASLEGVFKKHFPKSYFKGSKGALSGDDYRDITFRLVENKNLLPNQITDNDPALSRWSLVLKPDGRVSAELFQGGRYSVKSKNPYMVKDGIKLGWRNKTASPEQLVPYFDKFLAKAKEVMKQNVDDSYGDPEQVKIYKEHVEAMKSLKAKLSKGGFEVESRKKIFSKNIKGHKVEIFEDKPDDFSVYVDRKKLHDWFDNDSSAFDAAVEYIEHDLKEEASASLKSKLVKAGFKICAFGEKELDEISKKELNAILKEETLSDGSLVYNIMFAIGAGRATLAFPSRKDAEDVMDALNKTLD